MQNPEIPFDKGKMFNDLVGLLKWEEGCDPWMDLFCLELNDGTPLRWEELIGQPEAAIEDFLRTNLQDGVPSIWANNLFRAAVVSGNAFAWSQLKGMDENDAERYIIGSLGYLPEKWGETLFRIRILGSVTAPSIASHMNHGVQAYENSLLGADSARVWYLRNIAGQGHPGDGNAEKTRIFGEQH